MDRPAAALLAEALVARLKRYSLRSRLQLLLLVSVGLVALAQSVIAYRSASAEADEVFDYQMEQIALSWATGVTVPAAEGPPRVYRGLQDDFDFVVRIWSKDRTLLYQNPLRRDLPQHPAALGLSHADTPSAHFRFFVLADGDRLIEVAQDLEERREIAGKMMLRTLLPLLLATPVLMLAVWLVINRSMRALTRVSQELSSRVAEDLGQVAEGSLPDEVRPLVQELNRLLRRLSTSFDAQRSFVANAAHELRSPLAALRVQAQAIQRAHDDAARAVAVQRLIAGIDRATRLVGQMLALARQEASGPSSRAAPLDLLEPMRHAMSEVWPEAQAKHVDLGMVSAQPAPVRGDEEALRILFRNLLENAVKYTREHGTVNVSVQASGSEALVVVEDDGEGIPETDRARVFERFYRAPGAAASGSGLGLSICKVIVDSHGARMELGRSELGGLLVRLRFPLMAEERAAASVPR
jgi:two-component system OmpR family sensor kinase